MFHFSGKCLGKNFEDLKNGQNEVQDWALERDCHWNFPVNFILIQFGHFLTGLYLMHGHFVVYDTYNDISEK